MQTEGRKTLNFPYREVVDASEAEVATVAMAPVAVASTARCLRALASISLFRSVTT
jgi:hypothetical protein